MKKTRIVICAMMLLLVVMLLGNATTFPAVAQGAYHVGVTWGSRYQQEYPEVAEMGYLCMDIRGIFDQSYPTWVANNFFGPSTIASYVYQCSDSVKSMPIYDYLATFHVGHMFPYMYPYGHYEWPPEEPYPIWVIDGYVRHYAYYADSGAYYGITDVSLYPHAGAKHYFTMIWTCANGDLFVNPLTGQLCYGYYDSAHGTGWVGMPYAWTQTTGLDKTGYDPPIGSSNFCYIGFENMSKPVTESFQGSATRNYGNFIRRFYYHAVINQRSIKDALDYATLDMDVYGVNSFGASELYNGWDKYEMGQTWKCRMRVYGDGNNFLGVVG